MTNYFNVEKLLRLILKEQNHLYSQPVGETMPLHDNYINEFSRNENSVKVVFDHENFKILHISENVESIIGHTAEDFYKSKMLFTLKLFAFDHFTFIYVWLKWAITIYNQLGNLYNTKQTICGVKVKHKDGHILRTLFRYTALEMADNGVVKVAAISIDDITHLIKGDFYWGRLEQGENIHHFISKDKKDNAHDIISVREKDVLRLIAQGKESKEIAELLFISLFTVDNHRRNMIAKTGARDATALVQICHMCGII